MSASPARARTGQVVEKSVDSIPSAAEVGLGVEGALEGGGALEPAAPDGDKTEVADARSAAESDAIDAESDAIDAESDAIDE